MRLVESLEQAPGRHNGANYCGDVLGVGDQEIHHAAEM